MDIKDLTDSRLKEKFLNAEAGDVIKVHYKISDSTYYFILVTGATDDKFYLVEPQILKRIEPYSETSLESLYDRKFVTPEGIELVDSLEVYNNALLTIKQERGI